MNINIKNERYDSTIATVEDNLEELIDEMIFIQHAQTAILRNDHYMIKDKETQAVFESVLCKYQTKINPNNHQKAYDLKHNGNQISIKSGTVTNGQLKISYSRTTEHVTLEDKINYLSTFENLILGLATEKLKCDNENVLSKTKYHLYYFPANLINLKAMKWEENPSQYYSQDDESGISIEIKKKMSDQPWITLPISSIPCVAVLTVSVMTLNSRKYLSIQREDTGERLHYDLYDHRKKLKQLKGLQKCTIFTPKVAMV